MAHSGDGKPGPILQPLDQPKMPPPRSVPPVSRLERETANDDIYEKIYIAILEHRLHPGTKLGEERLAKIFNVSRARVREVLTRLAHEQIIDLYPQRGAFVAKPSPEQAIDVFDARRLIEPAMLRRLIATLTPDKVARPRRHQELELDALRRDMAKAENLMLSHLDHIQKSLALDRLNARRCSSAWASPCWMVWHARCNWRVPGWNWHGQILRRFPNESILLCH